MISNSPDSSVNVFHIHFHFQESISAETVVQRTFKASGVSSHHFFLGNLGSPVLQGVSCLDINIGKKCLSFTLTMHSTTIHVMLSQRLNKRGSSQYFWQV